MKATAPVLAVVIALALVAAGCGSKKQATATTTTAASSFKVGLVHRHRRPERPQLQPPRVRRPAAAREAARRAGPRHPVANSSADYIPNLTALAQQGYNLIIGVGFTEIQAMAAVAKQFPKTHFAIIDVSNADEDDLPNVEGLLFREQEAGYLAGYAAGLAAKDRGGKAVSTVGGQKQPPVDRYIAGFQAGAKAAFPGVDDAERLLAGLRRTSRSARRSRSTRSRPGSVVVFQVAGGCGLGALDAAKEQNVWGIGVDADQGYLGAVRPHLGAEARRHGGLRRDPRPRKAGKFKGGT